MRSGLLSVLFLIVALLAVPRSSVGQAAEITHSDFWAAVRTSSVATRASFPRREIEKFEGSRAGQLSFIRTKTTDFSAADRFHLITEIVDGDEKTIEEMITIGTVSYCKKKSAEWDTKNCYLNPPSALETAVEEQFRVEKTDEGSKYFRKTIYLFQEAGKTEKTRFQSEDILILNPDMTVRERTITNTSQETGAFQSRQTWKNEYGIKLKPIEVPIK